MCKPTKDDKRVLAAETFFRNGRANRVVSDSEVKFEVPVNFSEVKILSSSMYLTTSAGGLIIGNTDPSQITLQFFCNNVHRPDAELVDLGTIEYEENRCSTFRCQTTIWSDTLTVRGKFYSLSIGVYGLPQDIYAEYLQRRDRSSNLPNLCTPGGISEVAIAAFNYNYLDSSPEMVIHSFEADYNNSEEEPEQSSAETANYSDVEVTSNGSQSDSQVDDEDESELEEEMEGEEEMDEEVEEEMDEEEDEISDDEDEISEEDEDANSDYDDNSIINNDV